MFHLSHFSTINPTLKLFSRTIGAKDKRKRSKKLLIGGGAVAGVGALSGAAAYLHHKQNHNQQVSETKKVPTSETHLGVIVPGNIAHQYKDRTHLTGEELHHVIDNALYYKTHHSHELENHEKQLEFTNEEIPNREREVYMRVKLPDSAKSEIAKKLQIPYVLKNHIGQNTRHEIQNMKTMRYLTTKGLNFFHRN